MIEANYSESLRNLSREYFNRFLSFDSYRIKRKQLLDLVDQGYNGAQILQASENYSETDTQPDFRKASKQKVETLALGQGLD
jgi:hypothetical protein